MLKVIDYSKKTGKSLYWRKIIENNWKFESVKKRNVIQKPQINWLNCAIYLIICQNKGPL